MKRKGKKKEKKGKGKEREKEVGYSTPSRYDPMGGSESDPGCSDTTISLYQNHLSKTGESVTFQLA